MSFAKMRMTGRRVSVEVGMLESAIARADANIQATNIYLPEDAVEERQALAEVRRVIMKTRDELRRACEAKRAVLGFAETYDTILNLEGNGPLRAGVEQFEVVNSFALLHTDLNHYRVGFGEDGILQPFQELEREGLD
jgi:hypothetical protein